MEFYRLKFEYLGEGEDGKLVNLKREDLVMAETYTDAEAITTVIMRDLQMFDENVKYEIVKTKIQELLFTNSFSTDASFYKGYVQYFFEEEDSLKSSALYAVNVVYIEVLDNGKKKSSKDTIYVAASNNSEAFAIVSKYLKTVETRDWTVRDVKYEKAEYVLVTNSAHESNKLKSEKAGL